MGAIRGEDDGHGGVAVEDVFDVISTTATALAEKRLT